MEIRGCKMKKKEKTITYSTDECSHERLRKIAPMWFYCVDCGKVFFFMMSMQFNYNEAIEHWAGIVSKIQDVKDAVRKAEKKEKTREKKAQDEAIRDYKERVKKGKLKRSVN